MRGMQIEAGQVAVSQDAAPGRSARPLLVGLGFAAGMLLGVSAWAAAPLDSHASANPPIAAASYAFAPPLPLGLAGIRPAAHAGEGPRAAALPGMKQRRPVAGPRMGGEAGGDGGSEAENPRREFLGRAGAAALAAALAGASSPVYAKEAEATAGLERYTDPRYGVSFGLPAGWKATPNELEGGRRIVIATSPGDDSTNIFLAFTPIRPDYTSLGSFGNIDFVANSVLPQCGDISYPCSFDKGDKVNAVMLDKSTVGGNYVYDYTIQERGGPLRHLRSLFTVKADGGASVLVGLTAQCLEPNYAGMSATFKEVLKSYSS
mmetsp:Transcript_24988/g.70385  ORF Transcript_24988/g.70385 Transcript_24988/m.70385 type:complete len:319 (-) Transcript_24988:195-1151(-)